MVTMLDVQDVKLLRDNRVSPSPCETPVPSYDEEENLEKNSSRPIHLPSHLPRLHLSKRIPSFSNNFAPLSRIPSQLTIASGMKEMDRNRHYLNTRPVSFTHYVIQHLDSLVQVITQPVNGQFKVIDNTHRLLYTVSRTHPDYICCGMEGPEVVFEAVNSQQQHDITFVKHSSDPCFNRLKYAHVKLQPDVPLGTIDQESKLKAVVRNCSGDILCKIRLEDPRARPGSLVFQVIPATKYQEWGRMEECGGLLITTFPKESDAVIKTFLIAAGVLMQYESMKTRPKSI
ncbi:uncharacterized protein [Palaemon carinicauda]|uniref:uncharacterized protein isoform X2 n=1 Tax=Palaemon carinicauda TaxID=392227 RepID=UPI0035B5F7BC